MDKLSSYDHQVIQKWIALGEAELLSSSEALMPAWPSQGWIIMYLGKLSLPPILILILSKTKQNKKWNCNRIFPHIFLPILLPLHASQGSQPDVSRCLQEWWEPRMVLQGSLCQAGLPFPFSLIEAAWPWSFQASNFLSAGWECVEDMSQQVILSFHPPWWC